MTEPATERAATERIEVQRAIAADPATIFGIVSSPDGHVAIDASGMLMSGTGEPAGAVGDTATLGILARTTAPGKARPELIES